jgi:hypothetical protein
MDRRTYRRAVHALIEGDKAGLEKCIRGVKRSNVEAGRPAKGTEDDKGNPWAICKAQQNESEDTNEALLSEDEMAFDLFVDAEDYGHIADADDLYQKFKAVTNAGSQAGARDEARQLSNKWHQRMNQHLQMVGGRDQEEFGYQWQQLAKELEQDAATLDWGGFQGTPSDWGDDDEEEEPVAAPAETNPFSFESKGIRVPTSRIDEALS